MWLAAGCCYSEVGKEERNLLGKVLTAEDITQVKSNLWLSKRDVEEESPALTKGSPPFGRAVVHLRELQDWAGGWVLPVCVRRGSPWHGAWAGESKKDLAVCVFISAAECQSRWLLCLFCSDFRTSSALLLKGVIYPALNEIGLIIELQFFPPYSKEPSVGNAFCFKYGRLTIRW